MGFFELFSGALAAIYSAIPNYGLAIIILTIGVRLVLLPLTVKQVRSQREMQLIQPEIKKIQTKYKGKKTPESRKKMNEEMMGLYKEHGVNPMAGCLPLLLQMPVFIALFRVLNTPLLYMGYSAVKQGKRVTGYEPTNAESVMQTIQNSDLARGLFEVPDKVTSFLGIFRLDCSANAVLPFGDVAPAIQNASSCPKGWIVVIPYLLLIAAMGATTFYSQKQMAAGRQAPLDPQAQQQQAIMKFMPLLFVVFGFGFPTGLTMYWTTSNLWTIGQQALMIRLMPPPASLTKGSDKAKSDAKGDKKPSGDGGGKPTATKPKTATEGSNNKGGAKSNAKGTTGAKSNAKGTTGAKSNGARSSRPRNKKKR